MRLNKFSKYFLAVLNIIIVFLKAYGFDLKQFRRGIQETPRYLANLRLFLSLKRQSKLRSPDLKFSDLRPSFGDRNAEAGELGSYFYQDLWAAKKIFAARPSRHIDIGSRIDGFIGHLLVFRSVDVIDIRPVESKIPELNFIQADATSLCQIETDSLESISSLHAAEHFGLGRYGDQIDPLAYKNFFKALIRVLRPNGFLYLSVPIGTERVSFDAHRVFDAVEIKKEFKELELLQFSAFSKKIGFVEYADLERSIEDRYQVGFYHFTKLVNQAE